MHIKFLEQAADSSMPSQVVKVTAHSVLGVITFGWTTTAPGANGECNWWIHVLDLIIAN